MVVKVIEHPVVDAPVIEVSVPLRGNGRESFGDQITNVTNNVLFQSPCGEMVVKGF